MSNENDERVTLWWSEGDRMMSRTFKNRKELDEFVQYLPKRKIIGQSQATRPAKDK